LYQRDFAAQRVGFKVYRSDVFHNEASEPLERSTENLVFYNSMILGASPQGNGATSLRLKFALTQVRAIALSYFLP